MVLPFQTNYSPSLQSKNARETSVYNWFHFLESRNFQEVFIQFNWHTLVLFVKTVDRG